MKDVKDDFIKSLLEHDVDEPLPPEHEQKIRAGLGPLLHAPAPSPLTDVVAKGGKLTSYGLVGAALVVGAGVGFVLGRGTAPAPTPIVASSIATPSTSTPAPPVVAASNVVSDPPSPPATTATATTTTASTVAARPMPSGDAFDRERSLLDRARAALVRHDPASASQALDESERDFPKSQHAEERDYLRIQIARERGDSDRARSLAKAFLTKYQESLYRARVEPLAQ